MTSPSSLATAQNETRLWNQTVSAVSRGDVDALSGLLLQVNAKARDSSLLRTAASCGQRACVERLLPLSDPDVAFAFLITEQKWAAADLLAMHVPAGHIANAVADAPPGTMPAARALDEARRLTGSLPSSGASLPRRL